MVIAFLGDSITEAYLVDKEKEGFVSLIGKELNINTINYGIGGTRIARQTNPTMNAILHDLDFVSRVEMLYDKADLVFVFGGTNDFGHGDSKLGNIESTSIYTFYGALKTLCERLIAKYGKDKIRFILPIHRLDEDIKNASNNLVLKDYVEALKIILDKYNLEYIDLESVFPKKDKKFNELLVDGLHPNALGHRLIADYLKDYIKKITNL